MRLRGGITRCRLRQGGTAAARYGAAYSLTVIVRPGYDSPGLEMCPLFPTEDEIADNRRLWSEGNMQDKAFRVSWDQLHRDARALAWRLVDHGEWDAIACITRGGLVP